MKNVMTTIPKSKYKDWSECLAVLQSCDGGKRGFWLVNTMNLPKDSGIGALCYMAFDGQIRGYFDVVDIDKTENWRSKHLIGKKRNTMSLILANWHPITFVPYTGFQGWRYTAMRP